MRNVAIYVDGQNLYHAARARQRMPDYEAILHHCQGLLAEQAGEPVEFTHCRIYVISANRALGFIQALQGMGYEVLDYLRRSRSDTFTWSTQIVLDVSSAARLHGVEHIAVASGDGNLSVLRGELERELGDLAPTLQVVGFPGTISQRWGVSEELPSSCLYKPERNTHDRRT